MSDNQKKASLFCLLAFLLGCLIASVGCSVSSQTEIKAAPVPITHPHDLTYPVTGYDLDKVATLEAECCLDCGFAPWTDSWCEFHYGT
jgi:hypothetical protein